MHVIECLCQILAHAVLTTFPRVGGEERDVLHVGSRLVASQEDAQGTLGLCAGGFQRGGVFLPVLAADVHLDLCKTLVLVHRVVINKTHFKCRLAALRTTGPEGETVGGVFLHGDTEESFILQTGEFVVVAGIGEAHIVGVAVEGTVVAYLKLAVGAPAHQTLGEFKRTVLHHLGIQTTVGSVVDVFKEDAIHRRLNRCTDLLGVHFHHMGLSRQSED